MVPVSPISGFEVQSVHVVELPEQAVHVVQSELSKLTVTKVSVHKLPNRTCKLTMNLGREYNQQK